MSDENTQVDRPATVQDAASLFYPQENATSDTDTSNSAPVEAEAVEAERSAVKEPESDVSNDTEASTDSVDAASDGIDDQGIEDEPLYIELNGKEISVKDVQDGLDNGLRQADYTKKTQELADSRKTLEADQGTTKQLAETLSNHIEALEHTFKKEAEEIDWEHLREYDTAEYLRLKEEQANKVESLDAAKAEVKKLNDDKYAAHINSEQQKLVDAFPLWADPATGAEEMEKDKQLINAYVSDNGFQAEEFETLSSSKMMIAVHKAAQFDALKKEGEAAEKIVRKAPRTIKPGPKQAKTKPQSAAELFYGTKKG